MNRYEVVIVFTPDDIMLQRIQYNEITDTHASDLHTILADTLKVQDKYYQQLCNQIIAKCTNIPIEGNSLYTDTITITDNRGKTGTLSFRIVKRGTVESVTRDTVLQWAIDRAQKQPTFEDGTPNSPENELIEVLMRHDQDLYSNEKASDLYNMLCELYREGCTSYKNMTLDQLLDLIMEFVLGEDTYTSLEEVDAFNY